MANPIDAVAQYWQQPGAGYKFASDVPTPFGRMDLNPVNQVGKSLGQFRTGVETGDPAKAIGGATGFAAGTVLGAVPVAKAALGLKSLLQPTSVSQAMRMPRPATAPVQAQNLEQAHLARQYIQNGYNPIQQINNGTAATMAANRATSAANLSRLPQSSQQVLNPGVPTGLR